MCKCRFYVSVCIDKQRWNSDKCEYECKELNVKGKYDKRFIWNPSNSECEYDKSRDIGEYSDYENGMCRKKLVDKLVEQYTKNIYEVKIAKITLKHYKNKWKSSCTFCIALFSVIPIINIGIGTAFIYYWHKTRSEKVVDNKDGSGTLTFIY